MHTENAKKKTSKIVWTVQSNDVVKILPVLICIHFAYCFQGVAKLKFLKKFSSSVQEVPEDEDYFNPQKRRRFQFVDKGGLRVMLHVFLLMSSKKRLHVLARVAQNVSFFFSPTCHSYESLWHSYTMNRQANTKSGKTATRYTGNVRKHCTGASLPDIFKKEEKPEVDFDDIVDRDDYRMETFVSQVWCV